MDDIRTTRYEEGNMLLNTMDMPELKKWLDEAEPGEGDHLIELLTNVVWDSFWLGMTFGLPIGVLVTALIGALAVVL